MLSSFVAQTARGPSQRTRPSRGSLSGTWSSLPLFVISARLLSTLVRSPCPYRIMLSTDLEPIHLQSYRVRDPQAVHQNRLLCLVRHPLARCVSLFPYPSRVRSLIGSIRLYLSVVRVRSREGRRNRAPPPRIRWKDGKKVNPAVAAAEDAKAAAARTA